MCARLCGYVQMRKNRIKEFYFSKRNIEFFFDKKWSGIGNRLCETANDSKVVRSSRGQSVNLVAAGDPNRLTSRVTTIPFSQKQSKHMIIMHYITYRKRKEEEEEEEEESADNSCTQTKWKMSFYVVCLYLSIPPSRQKLASAPRQAWATASWASEAVSSRSIDCSSRFGLNRHFILS